MRGIHLGDAHITTGVKLNLVVSGVLRPFKAREQTVPVYMKILTPYVKQICPYVLNG